MSENACAELNIKSNTIKYAWLHVFKGVVVKLVLVLVVVVLAIIIVSPTPNPPFFVIFTPYFDDYKSFSAFNSIVDVETFNVSYLEAVVEKKKIDDEIIHNSTQWQHLPDLLEALLAVANKGESRFCWDGLTYCCSKYDSFYLSKSVCYEYSRHATTVSYYTASEYWCNNGVSSPSVRTFLESKGFLFSNLYRHKGGGNNDGCNGAMGECIVWGSSVCLYSYEH